MSKRYSAARTVRSYNWGPFYIMLWKHPLGISIGFVGFRKLHPNQCDVEVEDQEEPEEQK